MTRYSPAERRDQIVHAALRLLVHTPLDQLSTRQIAAEVGISQPALFRHFPTRDHILAGAVATARSKLEVVAARVLHTPGSPLDKVGALANAIFVFVGENAWLPRLLFHDVGQATDNPQDAALRHLVSMQRALVSELVRGAQADGSLPPTLDPAGSGAAFVALLQGALLQWRMADVGQAPLRAPQVMAVWLAAARAGAPASTADTAQASPTPLGPAAARLDVRPIIRGGEDPLEHILAAVQAMPPDGVLVIRAPFKPTPLLTLLSGRGVRLSTEPVDDTPDWRVILVGPNGPDLLDYRDLEAPEPLERVLQGVAALAPGDALIAMTPRVPRLLMGRLATLDVDVSAVSLDDGGGVLHVRRPR